MAPISGLKIPNLQFVDTIIFDVQISPWNRERMSEIFMRKRRQFTEMVITCPYNYLYIKYKNQEMAPSICVAINDC